MTIYFVRLIRILNRTFFSHFNIEYNKYSGSIFSSFFFCYTRVAFDYPGKFDYYTFSSICSLNDSKSRLSNIRKRFLLSDGQPSSNIRLTVSPNPSIIFVSSTAMVPPHVSPTIVNGPSNWICFIGCKMNKTR